MKPKLSSLKNQLKDKPFSYMHFKKGAKSNRIRNKRDISEIHRIMWDYYKYLYANKLDNQDEMGKLLEI